MTVEALLEGGPFDGQVMDVPLGADGTAKILDPLNPNRPPEIYQRRRVTRAEFLALWESRQARAVYCWIRS